MKVLMRFENSNTKWVEYAEDQTGVIYARGKATNYDEHTWTKAHEQNTETIRNLNLMYGWNEIALDYNFFKSTQCDHEYVEYVGFKEIYRFCKKCDRKAS